MFLNIWDILAFKIFIQISLTEKVCSNSMISNKEYNESELGVAAFYKTIIWAQIVLRKYVKSLN